MVVSVPYSNASLFDFIVFPEDFNKNHPQTYQLFHTIEISPKAQELFENIKDRHDTIKVNFSETCFSQGNFSHDTKEMNISTRVLDFPNIFCEVFLWEACNAANFSLTLPQQFSRSDKEFAFFMEAAEHQSCVKRTEILKDYMQKAQENSVLKKIIEESLHMEISESIQKLDNDLRLSFKNYWEKANKLTKSSQFNEEYTHSKFYRDCYKENQDFFQLQLTDNYNSQMLNLIKYAFSFWKNKEDIPYISTTTQEFYRKVIAESLGE